MEVGEIAQAIVQTDDNTGRCDSVQACSTVVFDDANRKLPEIAAIRSGWFIDRFSLIRFTTPKAKSEDEPGRLGTWCRYMPPALPIWVNLGTSNRRACAANPTRERRTVCANDHNRPIQPVR